MRKVHYIVNNAVLNEVQKTVLAVLEVCRIPVIVRKRVSGHPGTSNKEVPTTKRAETVTVGPF